MASTDLIEPLPSLQHVLRKTLAADEKVRVQLKGAFKEALVCTDKRVMILKSGFMTGNMFGSDVFQLPYANVASAEVKVHLLSGYFEVSAGGIQNTRKSYWSNDRNTSSSKAPNCISLLLTDFDKFRAACAFIMDPSARTGSGASAAPQADISTGLDRLWALKTQGAINQAEYEVAKQNLLRAL